MFEIATIESPATDPSGWPCRTHRMHVSRAGTLEFEFADLRDVEALDVGERGRDRFALASPFAGRERLDVGDIDLLFSVSPDWKHIRLSTLRADQLHCAFEARLSDHSVPSTAARERDTGPLSTARSMKGKGWAPRSLWFDIVHCSWNGSDSGMRAELELGLLEGTYTIPLQVESALTNGKSIPEWPEPVWWLSVRFVPDPR